MGACREFLDLSPLGSVFPFAHGLKPLVSALPCSAPMQDLEWWPVLAWTWVLHPGWAVMVWSQASPLACSEHPLSTWAGFSCQLWLPCPILMKSHCQSEAWEIANHNFVYSSCGVCWVSGSICPQEPQSLGRGKEDQTGLVWSPDHRRQLGPPYVGHRAAQVFPVFSASRAGSGLAQLGLSWQCRWPDVRCALRHRGPKTVFSLGSQLISHYGSKWFTERETEAKMRRVLNSRAMTQT